MNSDRQQLSCVLDPALALSSHGLLLVENLATVMELWVVRELWHILNNVDFYLQRPELVIPKRITADIMLEENRTVLEETFWSLKEWKKMRRVTDIARLNLFWLGDSLRESFLPQNKTREIFWRWEFLAGLLDERLDRSQVTDDVLALAFRDAVALTASLGSSFILTYQLPLDFASDRPPDICKALENWGIRCQVITSKDPIVAMERRHLRQLMMDTGLAKLFWSGMHLAVVHLVGPATSSLYIVPEEFQANQISSVENSELEDRFWEKIQGFWYRL